MSKKSNGTLNMTFKYIAATVAIAGLLLTLGKLVWSASGQAKDIETTISRVDIAEPKIEENIKHRITGEIKYEFLVEKMEDVEFQIEDVDIRLDGMELKQTQILQAVQKLDPNS